MIRWLPPLLLLLAACSAVGDPMQDDTDTGLDPTNGADETTFRLDVFPSSGAAEDAAGAEVDLLPRTFRVSSSDDDVRLILDPPAILEGNVTGIRVAPYASSVPGVQQPVEGVLAIRKPDSVQSRTVTTDVNGHFGVRVMPDPGYRLEMVPGDPSIPVFSEPLEVDGDRTFDLDLGDGAPLYGRVLDGDGQALEGVEIVAVDAFGTRSTPVQSGPNGAWSVRVQPGSWSVVARGRDTGRDPILTSEPVLVDEEGTAYDVVYPNLAFYSVGGRMEAGTGTTVRDGVARFTAHSLQGYGDEASLVVETRADDFGNFDTRLLAGVWDVELFPADDQEITPVRLEGVQITGSTDLGMTTLPAMIPVQGQVVDPAGEPVEGALVDCEEHGFAARSYVAYSDESGVFSALMPRTPLACALVPPGDRDDVALTRHQIQPAPTTSPVLSFATGQLVSGTVRWDDQGTLRPLEFAVLELRDTKARLLGTALTQAGDGRFEVRVAPTD